MRDAPMDTKLVTMTTFVAILLALPLVFKRLRPRLRCVMAVDPPKKREELLYDTDDLLV